MCHGIFIFDSIPSDTNSTNAPCMVEVKFEWFRTLFDVMWYGSYNILYTAYLSVTDNLSAIV